MASDLSPRERIERHTRLAHELNQRMLIQHPVTAAIREGKASKALLKALVQNLYTFALESNAAAVGLVHWNQRELLLRAPEINHIVIAEKVMDELTNPGPSGHMRMLEILWKALGCAREELLLSSPAPEVRAHVDHHVRASLEEGRNAFDEEQFGHWAWVIYVALTEKYGFTPEETIYFSEHGEADTREHRDGIISHGEMGNLTMIRRLERNPNITDAEIEQDIRTKFFFYKLFLDGVAKDERRVSTPATPPPADPEQRVAALTAKVSERFRRELLESGFFRALEQGELSAEKVRTFVGNLYYFVKLVPYSTGLMYHYKKGVLRKFPALQDFTTGIIAAVAERWLPNPSGPRKPFEHLVQELDMKPQDLAEMPRLPLVRSLVDYRVRIIAEASLPESLALWTNAEDLSRLFARLGDALVRHYGVERQAASWLQGHADAYPRVLGVGLGELARRGLRTALEMKVAESTPGWGLEYVAETQVTLFRLFFESMREDS